MERRRAPSCPGLPNEIVEGVLLLLDEADLCRFSQVSRFWNRYIMSKSFRENYDACWHKASPSSSLSSSSSSCHIHQSDFHDVDDGFNNYEDDDEVENDDDDDDEDDDDSIDEYLRRIEHAFDDPIDDYLDRIEDAYYDHDAYGDSSDDNYEDEDDDNDDDREYSSEDIEQMERKVRKIKRKIREMEEAEVVTSRMNRKIEKLKVGMRKMKKKIRRFEEEEQASEVSTFIYDVVEPWVYDPSDYESGVIWM